MIKTKDVDFSEVAEKVNNTQISKIQKIETEIVVLKEQIAGNFIQVGQKLIEAKEEVEYGRWGEWLKEKVDFSHEQANRMMRIARECKDSSALTNLSQTKVFSLLALPEEEREEFIENNPVEDMTTRELEKAIKEKKQLEKEKEQAEEEATSYKYKHFLLEEENKELKNRKPKTVEIPVPTVPMDYEHIKESNAKLEYKITELSRSVEDKNIEIESATKDKEILERKAKLNEEDSKKYKQLKDEIENLSKEKDDLGRQIKSRTELSGLVVRIEHILKTELAPIKYSRAIDEASTDEVVTRNLRDIVGRVEAWCEDMYEYIPEKKGNENIIDVEVIEHE